MLENRQGMSLVSKHKLILWGEPWEFGDGVSR